MGVLFVANNQGVGAVKIQGTSDATMFRAGARLATNPAVTQRAYSAADSLLGGSLTWFRNLGEDGALAAKISASEWAESWFPGYGPIWLTDTDATGRRIASVVNPDTKNMTQDAHAQDQRNRQLAMAHGMLAASNLSDSERERVATILGVSTSTGPLSGAATSANRSASNDYAAAKRAYELARELSVQAEMRAQQDPTNQSKRDSADAAFMNQQVAKEAMESAQRIRDAVSNGSQAMKGISQEVDAMKWKFSDFTDGKIGIVTGLRYGADVWIDANSEKGLTGATENWGSLTISGLAFFKPCSTSEGDAALGTCPGVQKLLKWWQNNIPDKKYRRGKEAVIDCKIGSLVISGYLQNIDAWTETIGSGMPNVWRWEVRLLTAPGLPFDMSGS